LAAVERDVHDLPSVILLRRGTVVAEGYWEPSGPTYPHMLFSLSKSFTSTATGLLVADERLSVDDRVTVDQETNVALVPTELPRLEGRATSLANQRQ
jgi:Beta-lactamase